jgi:CBS domain-containing protein
MASKAASAGQPAPVSGASVARHRAASAAPGASRPRASPHGTGLAAHDGSRTAALQEYLSEGARRRLRGITATLENLRVKDAMTCNPITTSPEVPVRQAAAVMLEHRIGSLPVIQDGKLIGIMTDRDAVRPRRK